MKLFLLHGRTLLASYSSPSGKSLAQPMGEMPDIRNSRLSADSFPKQTCKCSPNWNRRIPSVGSTHSQSCLVITHLPKTREWVSLIGSKYLSSTRDRGKALLFSISFNIFCLTNSIIIERWFQGGRVHPYWVLHERFRRDSGLVEGRARAGA